MKPIFLHIGAHKTGSSAIQSSLRNLHNLKWQLLKPDPSGNPNSSLAIQAIFQTTKPVSVPKHIAGEGSRWDDLRRSATNLLEQTIETSSSSNFILSGEEMSNFNDEEFFLLRYKCRQLGLDPYIIGYLRKLGERASSAFQQRLFGMPLRTGLAYMAERSLGDIIPRLEPNYGRLVASLKNCFPMNRIRLFGFDRNSFPLKSVVIDFCKRLGIDQSEALSPADPNESLSTLAVKVLWIQGHAWPDKLPGSLHGKDMRQLKKELSGFPKFSFSPIMLEPYIKEWSKNLGEAQSILEDANGFALDEINASAKSDDDISSGEDLARLGDSERIRLKEIVSSFDESSPRFTNDIELVSSYFASLHKRSKQTPRQP